MTLQRNIATIDLSAGAVAVEAVPADWRHQYLGGRGIAARLLYRRICEIEDPARHLPVQVFSAGLLTGAAAPASSRGQMLSFGSPKGLVRAVPDAASCGVEMRWAGFDHLVVYGRAPRPVCICVVDGGVEIRDAAAGTELGAGPGTFGDLADERFQLFYRGAEKEIRDPASGNLVAVACRGSRPLEIRHPLTALHYFRSLLAGVADSDKGGRPPDAAGPVGQELVSAVAGCLGVDPAAAPFAPDLCSCGQCLAQLVALNTGLQIEAAKVWEIARRVRAVERLLYLRMGLDPEKEMALLPSGGFRAVPMTAEMRRRYYQNHEWNRDGVPTRRLLRRLGIDSLRPTKNFSIAGVA